jgi:hypothetical protein
LPFLILDGQFTHRTMTMTIFGPSGTASGAGNVLDVSA